MSSPFTSAREFKQVMDELFTPMSENPRMGPAPRETLEERYPHLVV